MNDTYDPRAYFENTPKEERDAVFQSYISKKNTHPVNAGLILPALLFVIAAVLFVIAGADRISQWRRESACTELVIGTVTETADGYLSTGKRPENKTPFQDVRYSYSYNGVDHTAVERIYTKKEAKQELGSTRGLYIDPSYPESVRFPGKSASDPTRTVFVGCGAGLLAVGTVLLLANKSR